MENAFVTLALDDGYAIGALVLGYSLKAVETKHNLHVLYTNEVSDPLRTKLSALFNSTSLVNVQDPDDQENLGLIKSGREELNGVFTKLSIWRLTQFGKAVFLSSNLLVLSNIDELFERPELSATPNSEWNADFDSHVLVFTPSLEKYRQFVEFGLQRESSDSDDQPFLNECFPNYQEWNKRRQLPAQYHMSAERIPPNITNGKPKIVYVSEVAHPWRLLKADFEENPYWAIWKEIFETNNVKADIPKSVFKTEAFKKPDTQDQRDADIGRFLTTFFYPIAGSTYGAKRWVQDYARRGSTWIVSKIRRQS